MKRWQVTLEVSTLNQYFESDLKSIIQSMLEDSSHFHQNPTIKDVQAVSITKEEAIKQICNLPLQHWDTSFQDKISEIINHIA